MKLFCFKRSLVVADSDHFSSGELYMFGLISSSTSSGVSSGEKGKGIGEKQANRSRKGDENLASLEVLLSALIILPFDEPAGWRLGTLKRVNKSP